MGNVSFFRCYDPWEFASFGNLDPVTVRREVGETNLIRFFVKTIDNPVFEEVIEKWKIDYFETQFQSYKKAGFSNWNKLTPETV
jgi:hypothetical protein